MRFEPRHASRSAWVRQLLCEVPPPRDGRNPRTGEAVKVPGKYVPYFRAGKEIRDQLNAEILKDQ